MTFLEVDHEVGQDTVKHWNFSLKLFEFGIEQNAVKTQNK